jgi:quinol monooxygenase YgiN
MTERLALLAQLEAKPGMGERLAAVLGSARVLAAAEIGTVSRYAFRIGDTRFGIFDTFETDDAREDHLNGEIPATLSQVAADLLAAPPDIQPVEIIAVK